MRPPAADVVGSGEARQGPTIGGLGLGGARGEHRQGAQGPGPHEGIVHQGPQLIGRPRTIAGLQAHDARHEGRLGASDLRQQRGGAIEAPQLHRRPGRVEVDRGVQLGAGPQGHRPGQGQPRLGDPAVEDQQGALCPQARSPQLRGAGSGGHLAGIGAQPPQARGLVQRSDLLGEAQLLAQPRGAPGLVPGASIGIGRGVDPGAIDDPVPGGLRHQPGAAAQPCPGPIPDLSDDRGEVGTREPTGEDRRALEQGEDLSGRQVGGIGGGRRVGQRDERGQGVALAVDGRQRVGGLAELAAGAADQRIDDPHVGIRPPQDRPRQTPPADGGPGGRGQHRQQAGLGRGQPHPPIADPDQLSAEIHQGPRQHQLPRGGGRLARDGGEAVAPAPHGVQGRGGPGPQPVDHRVEASPGDGVSPDREGQLTAADGVGMGGLQGGPGAGLAGGE